MNVRTLIATVPVVMAGVLFTSPAVTAAPTARAATPKALSLSLADIQHVYGPSFRPFMVHAYPASPKGTCGGHYTGGYLGIFGNFKKATGGKAVVSVEDAVFAYPNGTARACMLRTSRAPQRSIAGMKSHTSSLGGIGDGASLTSTDSPTHRSYTLMISFYRGSHSGLLIVSGFGGRPALADVIRLATVLDQRFQHAG